MTQRTRAPVLGMSSQSMSSWVPQPRVTSAMSTRTELPGTAAAATCVVGGVGVLCCFLPLTLLLVLG